MLIDYRSRTGLLKLVKMAALIAKDTEKQIMLPGFQTSHGVGLKGSSHNHHIFYVHW